MLHGLDGVCRILDAAGSAAEIGIFLRLPNRIIRIGKFGKLTYSGYGRYENEIATHIFVNLYRITDDCIELMELDAITNPIQEGDDVPWSVTTLIPVELAPGAADTLRAMDGKDIFTINSRAVFSDTVTDLLMPSQHTADETVVQLMSSSQFLY